MLQHSGTRALCYQPIETDHYERIRMGTILDHFQMGHF